MDDGKLLIIFQLIIYLFMALIFQTSSFTALKLTLNRRGLKYSARLFSSKSPAASTNANFQILKFRDINGTYKSLHYIDVGPVQSPSAVQPKFDRLPVVLLGGTAQSISTYMPHIKQLAKTRRVIMPELRCQGTVTDLDPFHANMEQYVKDVVSMLQALELFTTMSDHNKVGNYKAAVIDMVGFSFGGRVSLAVAANYPHLISHLSITGVPFIRPLSGNTIINEWKLLLSQKQYYACAESFLVNGYHAAFLDKHRTKLSVYADMILANNNMSNLYQLLLFSHYNNTTTGGPLTSDNTVLMTGGTLDIECSDEIVTSLKGTGVSNSDFVNGENFKCLLPNEAANNKNNCMAVSIDFCVQHIQCKTQVIAGLYDKIAGYDEVQALAQKIRNATFIEMETGHLAPFEDPILWRKLVHNFLDS